VMRESHSMLVRVLSVRSQNAGGAIFRAQRITSEGEIVDTHAEVVARLHRHAVAVKVVRGQWWTLKGELSSKTFVNQAGFSMTEDHLEVAAGGATLRLPSGAHIVDFLANRFEGVGPRTAERLWETFGEGLVAVLDEGDYQALADVVSPEKARLLIEGWKSVGMGETLQFLQTHGVGLSIGRKVIAVFGDEAMSKIEENPYRLTSFSAGWSEVDRLATEQLGVDPLDERRLASMVEEVVYRRFSLGDTFVPYQELVMGMKGLIRGQTLQETVIQSAIELAASSGRLLFDSQDNAYSLGASILENRVVDAIAARLAMKSPPCNVSAIIDAYEAKLGHGIRLNAEQLAAVEMVASNHFSIITGGAGCGKTTVLKAVCELLEDQGYSIVQLALAGKAVKRMQEGTGRPAMTLASFLSKAKKDRAEGRGPVQGPMAVLIDEASMVDLLSFSGLVRDLDGEVKIVLIGDPHQLPPVGPGLVLHCLTGGEVPHVELKVAKRFGTEIADVANAIKAGVLPTMQGQGKVRLIETADAQMALTATDLYLESPAESVVLCATRAMSSAINQCVQERVGSARQEVCVWNEEYDCWEGSGLREGDLVICTHNHWDLGLQNGSIGRMTSKKGASTVLGFIEWDDGIVRECDIELLDSLELAYALTVHKSQGSQWSRVIVCLPSKGRLIDRSLVYTAVTRAQSEVIMLGSPAAISATVAKAKAADRRRVGLSKRLERMVA
jgi:exodeoxyribonuclease V alpha subunit